MTKAKTFKKNIPISSVIIIICVIIGSIGIAIFTTWWNNLNKEIERDRELRNKEYVTEKCLSELKDLIQKAVRIEYKTIQENKIIFEITNLTKKDIKDLSFLVMFLDAFGEKLQYDKAYFSFKVIDPVDVIQSGYTKTIGYDLYGVSRNLQFDIYKYKEHLQASIETFEFTFSDGSSFSPYGVVEEYCHKKEFLKSNMLYKSIL